MTDRPRIGIYGGTFDPIHHGHLILAREAAESLDLEQVIFVPAARSPHKLQCPAAPASDRLAMVRAAVHGEPRFAVDEIELNRPPPSFTIDTIEILAARHPQRRFSLLVGEDNVDTLETWHRFAELRAMVDLVVLERSGLQREHPYRAVRRHIDISATDIRNRVARGASIRYLVPTAVEEIIRERQLYRESEI
ncbi:MAG: nicotinate-nucleotide adenylyltransferase [Verrucomicrobiota bacterium]|nr:nicotinate-nucleotide adenylyltransferase [Verrucomicrobiota bacterium]